MRVLVTYGWCRTAYAAAESLSQAGFDVYASGSSALSMTRVSRFVRGFNRVPDPFKCPESFANALVSIVQDRKIDILLPVHEDALIIQKYRHIFPNNVIIACPKHEDLSIALDKYQLTKLASAAGIQVPSTYEPKNIDQADIFFAETDFPLIIKTRHGNSGKGVFLVQSESQAKSTFRDVVKKYSLSDDNLPICQEFIDGQICGSCFLADKGEVKACFTERYLRCKQGKFGTSVLREPADLPELKEDTSKIVRALNWTGIGHFDFIMDEKSRRPVLIEMNPRFWGALNMAIKNGYDFPRALVTMLTNGKPNAESFQPKEKPVKSLWIAGEMIAAMDELMHGKLFAPLMSLRRVLLHRGRYSFDDFRWNDPFPLLVEMVHYATGFFLSGGNVNPEAIEMMR